VLGKKTKTSGILYVLVGNQPFVILLVQHLETSQLTMALYTISNVSCTNSE